MTFHNCPGDTCMICNPRRAAEEIEGLRAALAERDREIGRLRESLGLERSLMEEYAADNERLREREGELECEVTRLNEEIAEMRAKEGS